MIIASEDSLGNKLNSRNLRLGFGFILCLVAGGTADARVALIPERETYQVGEKSQSLDYIAISGCHGSADQHRTRQRHGCRARDDEITTL